MTKIIAFSGRKQSGKSTGSDYTHSFLTEYGISSKIYSFADPLKKDICMNMLGLTYDQCYGSDDDKNTLTSIQWKNLPGLNDKSYSYGTKLIDPLDYMTAREVMEIIGTDIFRRLNNSVWVDATMRKIKEENPSVAIIADCRFPNESDAILDKNGLVIRLTLDPFKSQTNSESALDMNKYDWTKFSCIIDNRLMTTSEKNQSIETFLTNKGILQL